MAWKCGEKIMAYDFPEDYKERDRLDRWLSALNETDLFAVRHMDGRFE